MSKEIELGDQAGMGQVRSALGLGLGKNAAPNRKEISLKALSGAFRATGSSIEAVALLLMVGTLLAASTITGKLALSTGWPPLSLLVWSLAGAALLLALWLICRALSPVVDGAGVTDGPSAEPGRALKRVAYFAGSGLLFAVPNAIAFTAVGHVGAGFVALCFAFPLVLTYALSVGLGLERFSGRRGIGVGLAVLGGIILAIGGISGAPDAPGWVLAALAMPVVIAIGNIYRSVLWPKGVSPVMQSAAMLGFGAGLLVPLVVLNGLSMAPVGGGLAPAYGLLALQVAIFTALYGFYFRLQRLAGAVYLSQIGSVAAVSGLLLAYLVLAEVPGAPKLFAVAVIGAGVVFVSWRPSST